MNKEIGMWRNVSLSAVALGALLLFAPVEGQAQTCDIRARAGNDVGGIYIFGMCPDIESARQACIAFSKSFDPSINTCQGGSGPISQYYTAGWFLTNEYIPNVGWRAYRGGFHTPYTRFDPMPEDNAGAPPCPGQCFGDPINAGTGNKYQIKTEYQSGGALPLEFTWTYNSQSATASMRREAYTLGRNRTHTYSGVLDHAKVASSPLASLSRPNGKILRFRQVGQDWIADASNPGRLTQKVVTGATTGWEFDDGKGRYESYDPSGRLIAITDLSGNKLSLAYGSSGMLQSVTDLHGRSLSFSYDNSRRIKQIAIPEGGYLAFSYSSDGDLIKTEYADGSAVQYLYNESGLVASGAGPGLLTGVIDENQNRFSSTVYDAKSAATSTYLGNSQDLYSASYNLYASATINLPTGATRSLQFSAPAGIVVTTSQTTNCSDCSASTESYTYDSNGRVDIATVNGVTTDSDYNDRGLLLRKVEAANDVAGNRRVTETDWHANFPVPLEQRIKDASAAIVAKRTWSYNARGQVLESKQIDPADPGNIRVSRTKYCEQADVTAGVCPLLGQVIETDGPRSDILDVTRYTYYASDDPACATAPANCAYRKGDLRKIANALGQAVEYLRYDPAGRALSSKDPNGVVTDLEYTPRGWLAARKVRGADPNSETDDAITRYEYDLAGQVKKVIQPDGSFVRYQYDAAHRLTDIFDMAGNQIHYTLDAAGNRIKEDTQDANGALKRTLSRIYNQLGQLKTAKTAEGHPTGYTYDADGNGDVVTDALGHKTDNDYDPLGRLAKTLQDVGGINAKTEFKYDAQDRLVRVTDPKNLNTDYAYNGFGDQVRLSSPDTGVSTFTYDSAGNRKTATDARGITQTYSYDALNRVTGVSYPTSSLNVAYVYDSVPTVCAAGETFTQGRLTLMTDGSGSTQYCYDRFGNTTRKVQTTNDKVFTVRYGYTLAGQLSSLTYPDGAVVAYQRDAQGRINRVDAKRGGGVRTKSC